MSNSEARKRLAESISRLEPITGTRAPWDEPGDVGALVEVFNNHDPEQPECDPSLVCSNPAHLAVELLASEWLAAGRAEQRRLGREEGAGAVVAAVEALDAEAIADEVDSRWGTDHAHRLAARRVVSHTQEAARTAAQQVSER